MDTVAVSPTTGLRPGGQVAGPVVKLKLIRPLVGVIRPDLAWRCPPGWVSLPRVAHAKSTSTTARTGWLPSPATEPEQVTVWSGLSVQVIGLLVTSCGLAASAGTAARAKAISDSTAIMPIFLIKVFSFPVGFYCSLRVETCLP